MSLSGSWQRIVVRALLPLLVCGASCLPFGVAAQAGDADDLEALLGTDDAQARREQDRTDAPESVPSGEPHQEQAQPQTAAASASQAPLATISVEPLRDDQATASTTRARASGKVIEEIIVTATKRDTSLMQTGIAISVLGADQLKFQDINSVEDMQNSVPGMRVGTILGTPQVSIRGVGLSLISGLGNPGVAAHYDGVYLPRSGSVSAASVDLDRVEVLRGPQGTLYGRNATGGSVNFIAKRPAHEFHFGASLGLGNYDRQYADAYVEGPLGQSIAARAYLGFDRFDGYGINETSGESIGGNDVRNARLSLVYDIAESLDLYASYSRREDDGAFPYSTALSTVTTLSGRELPADEQSYVPFNTKGLKDPRSVRTTEVGNLTFTWRPSDYTFKSITGFVGHDRIEDMTAPEIERFVVYIYRHERSQALSQELNLAGSGFDGKLDLLGGAYYMVDDGATPFGAFINLDEFAGQGSNTNQVLVFPPDSQTYDTSQALFIDGSWSFRQDLRLLFGLRSSKEVRELTQTFQPYVEDGTTGLPVVPTVSNQILQTGITTETCEDLKSSKKTTSLDPKLGLEWDAVTDVLLYAQYQTAYKAGGFNTSTRCDQSYEPEKLTAYEVGSKASMFDGTLTFNTAAFLYAYDDYQVERTEGFGSVIDNAAQAESVGAEVELSWILAPWLSIDAQYSYLDATFKEFFQRDNFENSSVLVQDAPIQDLSGNRISRSPRYTVNLAATLMTNVGRWGLGAARLRFEGFYSDAMYFREFNLPIERQESYTTLDTYVSVQSADGKYALSVFGKNLTDKRYQVGQIGFDAVYYRGAYYGPPRTFGASVSMDW